MLILTILFLLIPNTAQAYIGPALGIGALALALLFILAIIIVVFSIIYYPLQYIKKKIKK